MSKLYTTNTAALKAVTIDSNTIDAKKLKIYPGTGEKTERKDIIEIIDDNIDELESQLNPYLNQQIHSTPDGGGTMGAANILVIPANIFNPSKFFKYVKIVTRNVNDVEHIPAYLGIILWDKNGNKTVLAVSENTEITSVSGTKLFSFSKAFNIPADTRILFYLLKSQEDIASEYPNYDENTMPKISCAKTIASNYDPYPNDWDNALADIDEGFIVNGSWAVNHAYAMWPVFSMIEDIHELNGSHLTPEQYQKLENLNLSDISSINVNLTSHIEDGTHLTSTQKNTISECTNSTYTTVSDEAATAEGNFDAVHFKYQDVPHDFPIKKFILKTVESSNIPNTPLYMAVWTQAQSGEKTYVGLSDEAITWEAGKDAVWTFNNIELIVPENHNVEFFLCTGADAINEVDATAPGVYIKTKYNPNGRGNIRYGGSWAYTRCIQAIFNNNGYLSHVGDDSHLSAADRELLKNLANSANISEANEVSDTFVTVTVDDITLDASVTAQNRMARAILVMEEGESVQWLSNDGAIVTLTKSQLKQALKTAVGNEINSWIGT